MLVEFLIWGILVMNFLKKQCRNKYNLVICLGNFDLNLSGFNVNC